MTLSWDAVTALATLASTVVVAVAAVAAVLQIRHLRAGNQLEAVLRMYERFDSPEMIEARRYCIEELPSRIADPAARAAMAAAPLDPRLALMTAFYTEIGALVNDGFLESRLINRLGPAIVAAWDVVEPLAYEMRKRRPEPVWAGFEYMAEQQRPITGARRLGRYPRWFRRHVALRSAELLAESP